MATVRSRKISDINLLEWQLEGWDLDVRTIYNKIFLANQFSGTVREIIVHEKCTLMNFLKNH